MSRRPITYTPRPDATPGAEMDALASIYRFIVFESTASKKGTRPGAPDDRKGPKHDPATTSIP